MSEILQYKTIESCDKKEFDRLVTEHLNSGWELVEGGYYPSDDLYVRELVWKKKENVDVEFWDNGQISYHRTPNKLICWHENGKIREEGTFKNQEMDGMWTHWFENGMKRTEKNYNNGKITGKWTYWEEDGTKY